MIMPFGIPSEDFHGGFGLPHDDDYVVNYDDTDGDVSDEEYNVAAQEAHDNLIRSLVEASGEAHKARELLVRALDQLYLLGYDSGFTNPAIEQLVTDIKFYLNGGKLNGSR
jgi:hypothetical protein